SATAASALITRRRACVQPRERKDDRAVQDLFQRLRRVEDRQQRIEDGQDQRAENSTALSTASSENRSAADIDRGYRGKQEGPGNPESGRIVKADDQDPRHCAERT